jgi:2-polyprenyl-3-methyl-5-hydroxy-6-metoxy-1,4-benzoquinol methylase
MPLSHDDVRYGFIYVLGRPENGPAIDMYSREFDDVETFRQHLMQSPEYQAKNPPAVTKSFLAHTEPSDVDTVMDQRTLESVVRKTASYWSKIGSVAPHWSVLSQDKYAPDKLSENLSEFYGSGVGDLYLVRDLLRRMSRSSDGFECILEFGCGVGRATAPLASAFRQVIALDISAPHIEIAKQHVASSGAKNVRFIQVTPEDIMPGHGYNLWYSRLVLQHNPPPVTLSILNKAFTGLLSNGVAIVHLRTHENGYRFKVSDYLAHGPSKDMEMHSTPQSAILAVANRCGCRLVELHEEPGHIDNVTNIFVFEKQEVGT